MPYYNRDPKRDPNFDNHPYDHLGLEADCALVLSEREDFGENAMDSDARTDLHTYI